MKKLLLTVLFVLFVTLSFSQSFDVETIKNSGDNDKRINIVVLGDGYTTSELTLFRNHALNFSNSIFSQSPFSEYAEYFNVHIINVISNESGASHPRTSTDTGCFNVPILSVDNYFGTAYDSYGSHHLLYTPNSALISTVLANNFPEYDQALILVNAPYYGGSGAEFPIASTGVSTNEITIHEIGHSLVNLKDEYYPEDALAEEGINMTQESDPTLVKWVNWVGTNNIGVYKYCNTGSCSTWYRPHQKCKMRTLGKPFCAVCKEGIIEKIHDLVSPIDSFNPNNLTIETPLFPIDFNVSLITPASHSLNSVWTLNGSDIGTDVDMVSILETDLNKGLNSLSVVITDNSSMQRIDDHATIHANVITWSIDTSTLGITEIQSEENKFSIRLYPNPSNDRFFIKFDDFSAANLRLELTSLEGKQVLSTSLNSGTINVINLNDHATGLYIANIYSDSVLLASKKVIKK
ncbi:T9SS type A sorting domain-containing protein [Bizionia argentinensis JUB59]|uniref:T9SS type A sorting domain-containing protein n=1 Tax=Bizionia argentinensis JUB59 TaxID=1046627 RepID=G2EBM0_9FLAO|nr:M64 family metallopeptidase [Bizionia argentinensis]EGV44113.1 T9SS type A sorting domain-containing protein [Bizionia argentinensis JUB59]